MSGFERHCYQKLSPWSFEPFAEYGCEGWTYSTRPHGRVMGISVTRHVLRYDCDIEAVFQEGQGCLETDDSCADA